LFGAGWCGSFRRFVEGESPGETLEPPIRGRIPRAKRARAVGTERDERRRQTGVALWSLSWSSSACIWG
jgi:hypothetical protein